MSQARVPTSPTGRSGILDPVSEIRVSAVLLTSSDGRVLLVRKRGTSTFMNPGGKPFPDEGPAECVIREVREELSLDLDPERLLALGEFAAPAANEVGQMVRADCYRYLDPVPDGVSPAAEIAEIAWLDPEQPAQIALAPLYAEHLQNHLQ